MVEEKKVEGQQVLIDFEGESNSSGEYERVVVKEDVYTAKISSVELQHTKKYMEEGTEPTLVFKVVPIEGQGAIPFFVKPKVTKAYSEKVSNSKLYDLLELEGSLNEAKASKEELTTLAGLSMFCQKVLVGRTIKFITKTRKKGTDEAYSSVDRVLEFVEETQPVKQEASQ